VKLALVTTPTSVRSGIGDYTRHLFGYLREHFDVEVFVQNDLAGQPFADATTLPLRDLDPRTSDRILYQLGNERSHAFMLPSIKQIGGTVALHDWVLFDLATAAFPDLERGGLRGHLAALREGGVAGAKTYAGNRRARRNLRTIAPETFSPSSALVVGWHEPEAAGRWTAARCAFRLPAGTTRVELDVSSEPGRLLRIAADGRRLGRHEFKSSNPRMGLALELDGAGLIDLAVDRTRPTAEQRTNGDTRTLGVFVHSIEYEAHGTTGRLDLSQPLAQPLGSVQLSDARFELPLNRSVVRHADAFVVHSAWMRRMILAERNAATPVAVVFHGAERRWSDASRQERRSALLPEALRDGVLIASFGAVQEHKRVEPLLRGFARAYAQRPNLRLVLGGELRTERVDVLALAHELGIEDAFHVTGFLSEEAAWDLLHASDIAVNLRGPSTGGTSGGVFQALSLGRFVIASDREEQAELPSTCVLKVAPGQGEVDALGRHFVELADDPERRRALEHAARTFVDSECHWSHCARQYADFLQSGPAHPAKRKSLIQTAIEQSDRAREERLAEAGKEGTE